MSLKRSGLDRSYLRESSLVAFLARVFGPDVRADHVFGQSLAHDAASEHEHVHRIVLDALVGRVVVLAVGGTDSRDLVRRDARPHPGTTKHDSAVDFSADHRQRDLLGVIGIVDTLGRIGSDIDHFMTQGLHESSEVFLEIEACMIRAEDDLQASPPDRTLFSERFAAATTSEGSKPNSFCNSAIGALAPNRVMPMISP